MPKGILTLICTTSIVMAAACSDPPVDPPPADVAVEAALPDQGVDLKKDVGPLPDADGAVPPDVLPDKCVLTMKINAVAAKNAVAYSSLDDQDKVTTGLQLEVVVEVTGTKKEQAIDLEVTGQTTVKKSSSSLKATFSGVLLDPKSAPITIEVRATGCTGVKASNLTVVADPKCTFVKPDKKTLTPADNESGVGAATFTYTISVKTENALKGSVDLTINAASAQPSSTAKPGSTGVAIFKVTQLKQNTNNDIKATVTVPVTGGKLTASCTPTNNPVYVDTSIPKCDCCGFSPSPKGIAVQPLWGLGAKEDSDNNPANGVQTTITITTDSKKVDQVTLDLGDGSAAITKKVTADKVTFPVTIKEGLHSMKASCENTTTKAKGAGSFKILVDITKPKAVGNLACGPKGSQNREGKATCTWTGVTDPGTSPSGIKQYQLRHLENTKLTKANWDGSSTVKLKVPAAPTANTKIVDSLVMPNTYYFGVKAEDHLGNLSDPYFPKAGAKIDFSQQSIKGAVAKQQFGNYVAVGDFNCDGKPDLAVGLVTANTYKGEVQLFFGTGNGFPSTFSKKIVGTKAVGLFGIRLRALNFDNDINGCTDLAVAAYGSDTNRGRVYLYLGRQVWKDRDDESNGKGAEIIYHLDTTAGAKEHLGIRIGAADLDGDKADDLAIHHWDPSKGWATVLVDYGEKGLTLMGGTTAPLLRKLPGSAELKITGGKSAASFGLPLANGGQLDSGTYEDMIIGAGTELSGTTIVGGAYVLLGQARATGVETVDMTKTSTRVIHITGDSTTTRFGSIAAGVGDLNGDKTPEFVISDPDFASGTATKTGKVFIFNLSGTAPKSVTDAKSAITNDLTSSTGNWFGRSIANGAVIDPIKGADLNKDGNADLLIGMALTGSQKAGSAKIFYGKTGTLTNYTVSKANHTLQSSLSKTANFSGFASYLTDINNDGYVDMVISDSGYSNLTGQVVIFY